MIEANRGETYIKCGHARVCTLHVTASSCLTLWLRSCTEASPPASCGLTRTRETIQDDWRTGEFTLHLKVSSCFICEQFNVKKKRENLIKVSFQLNSAPPADELRVKCNVAWNQMNMLIMVPPQTVKQQLQGCSERCLETGEREEGNVEKRRARDIQVREEQLNLPVHRVSVYLLL